MIASNTQPLRIEVAKLRLPARSLLESLLLILFTTIAGLTSFFHEHWSDEAQAWLLARDLSIPGILHQMGYEGSPPLWHLLLWLLIQLHLPFAIMGAVTVLLSAAGMYLWLRYSPLPAAVRYLVPFTFYYLYQYPVVSRSYALSTLLAFAAVAVWRAKPVRIIPLAALLALLAQSNMHGFTIAMGIAAAFAWEQVGKIWHNRLSKQELAHCGVGGALVLLSALVARKLASPAPDCGSNAAAQFHQNSKLEAFTKAFDGFTYFSKAIGLTPSWTPILILVTVILAVGIKKRSILCPAIATGLLVLYPLNSVKQGFGVTQSAVAFVLVLVWFVSVKRIVCALPFLFTVFAMGLVWSRPWHYGMALTAFLVAVWGAWDTEALPAHEPQKLTLATALATLVLMQLPATAKTIMDDLHGPYSGAKAAAAYLSRYVGERPIYCTNFYGTGIQPYFKENIFANWPTAYWTWSTKMSAKSRHILEEAPPNNAIVVVPAGGLPSLAIAKSSAAIGKLRSHHFHRTEQFCGAQFWMGQISEAECYDIYQRTK